MGGTVRVVCETLPPRRSHTFVKCFPSVLLSSDAVAGPPPKPPPPAPVRVTERTVTSCGNSYWIQAKPFRVSEGSREPLAISPSVSCSSVKRPPLEVTLAPSSESVFWVSGILTAITATSS